jgi:hypothetical protein
MFRIAAMVPSNMIASLGVGQMFCQTDDPYSEVDEQQLQQEDTMKKFIQRFADKVIGVLSGWDRLVLRGTLRPIAFWAGMMVFLWEKQVKLQNFGRYVFKISQSVKEASCREAEPRKRPVIYLGSSKTDKADLAQQIAREDRVEKGLIAVFKAVEPCIGYDVVGDREKKKLVLIQRPRKCLTLYHYSIDQEFGFMGARIQTWFPFQIQVFLNGRERLSRQMDRAGIRYEKQENHITKFSFQIRRNPPRYCGVLTWVDRFCGDPPGQLRRDPSVQTKGYKEIQSGF